MKQTVLYKKGILTIMYSHYMEEGRRYEDLFDWLGDNDIITASEIGEDCICMAGTVFRFTDADERVLMKNGIVSLQEAVPLEEYLDFQNEKHCCFYKWYNNIV